MTCTYCQSSNSESDHRCRRCGRRLTGSAVGAPPDYNSPGTLAQAMGATALAVDRRRGPSATSETASSETSGERMRKPAQTSLFAEEFAPRVIPFDAQQRESLLKTSRAKRHSDSVLDETSDIAQPRRETPRA